LRVHRTYTYHALADGFEFIGFYLFLSLFSATLLSVFANKHTADVCTRVMGKVLGEEGEEYLIFLAHTVNTTVHGAPYCGQTATTIRQRRRRFVVCSLAEFPGKQINRLARRMCKPFLPSALNIIRTHIMRTYIYIHRTRISIVLSADSYDISAYCDA